MSVRIVIILVLANLRHMRTIILPLVMVGILLGVVVSLSTLEKPNPKEFRIGLVESDVPEIAEALTTAGFQAVTLAPGPTLDPASSGLDATVSLTRAERGLPRLATIAFPPTSGEITIDVRLRDLIFRASDRYAKRLSREAGLSPEAMTPIRISTASDGPMSKVIPVVLGIIDSGKFVPPLMLAVSMGMALFGVLPVLMEAFHMPRAAGRMEAFFPIPIRPRELAASLVGTQVVVVTAYTGLVVGIVHTLAVYLGLRYTPGYWVAIMAVPMISACVCPYVIAASTLFRKQTLSLFAAAVAGAVIGAIAYVPTVGAALGLPGQAFSAWPIHGMIYGDTLARFGSVALTAMIGLIGFKWACARLDGRAYVRVDA